MARGRKPKAKPTIDPNDLPRGVYSSRSKKGGYYIKYDGPKHSDGRRNPIEEHGFETPEAALEALEKIREAKKKGTYKAPTKLTLGEYIEEWMTAKEMDVQILSIRSYRNWLNTFQPIYSVKLLDLTAYHIHSTIIHKLKTKKGSLNSAKHYLDAITAVLKSATKAKLIPENPALDVTLPKRRNDQVEVNDDEGAEEDVVILSPQEVNVYLEHYKGVRLYHDLATVYFDSGARRGEILGLREKDCDFKNNKIRLFQNVVPDNAGRGVVQGSMKTKGSKRTISMSAEAMAALQRQITQRKKDKLKAGSSYTDKGLVFARPDGTPLSPNNVSKWFTKSGVIKDRDETGKIKKDKDGNIVYKLYRPDFHLHVTRHTHASLLILSGEDIITVSKRLGHATVTMTLDKYGHLLPEKDRGAADKFRSLINQASF